MRRLRLNCCSVVPASSVSGPQQQFLELSKERGAQHGREEVGEQAKGREGHEKPERARARVQRGQPASGAQWRWGRTPNPARPHGPPPPGTRPLDPKRDPPPTSRPVPPALGGLGRHRPAPADLRGATPPRFSPLLHRARVALEVAEARELVDQTTQRRRTWGRGGDGEAG